MTVIDTNFHVEELNKSKSGEEVQRAVAALEQHLAHISNSPHSKRRLQCIYTVLKSVLSRMSDVSGGRAIDQLLHLADACFSQCHTCCRDEHYVILLYSYMKKLAAANRLDAALRRGEQLLAVLGSVGAINSSSARKDLMLGAGLNVLMCHCKIRGNVLAGLHSINTATHIMLQALGQDSDKALTQHADALCDVLLQLNSLAGREASQTSFGTSSDTSSTHCDVFNGVVILQQQLFQAASLSSKAGILPQLAVEAAAALPKTLKHCSVVSMLAAGRQHSSNTDKGASPPAASVYLAGMQALLQSFTLQQTADAAVCVHALTAFASHKQELGLEATLILGLLTCSSSSLEVDSSELSSITAIVQSAVAAVHAQTAAGMAQAAAAADSSNEYVQMHACDVDARVLDTLTNQVANISLSVAVPPRFSSSRGTSRRGRAGATANAGKATQSSNINSRTPNAAEQIHLRQQQQQQLAEFHLQLAVWCLQQLVDGGRPGSAELMPLCITYTIAVINIVTALHDSSCDVQHGRSPSPWGCAARAAAMVAGMLKELPAGDTTQDAGDDKSNLQSNSSGCTTAQLLPASEQCQLLLQFTAAMQQMIGFRAHSQEPDRNLCSGNDSSSGMRLSRKELRWLSWQLYTSAVTKETNAITESGSTTSSSKCTVTNPLVASHLLLLAWQSTLVQIPSYPDSTCSCSDHTTANCCCPEAAQDLPADQVSTAVMTLLQQAHVYLNAIVDGATVGSAANAEIATCNTAQTPGMPHVVVQHWSSIQLVVQQTTSVALQHVTAATGPQQAEVDQLLVRLRKVLKMYSRLRCMVAAVSAPSSSSEGSRSGNGNRRQRVKIQQRQQQQQQQQQQLLGIEEVQATRGWLPSALHLQLPLLQQQQRLRQLQQQEQSNPSHSSRGNIQDTLPVIHLAWLESKALLSIAEASTYSYSAVAAAAVPQVLSKLCSLQTKHKWDAAVVQATSQLVLGMVLCSSQHVCGVISDSSTVDDSGSLSGGSAIAALSKACQEWSQLLLQPQGPDSRSRDHANASNKRGGNATTKGRVKAASSGSSNSHHVKIEAAVDLDLAEVAETIANQLGVDVAPGVLMLAALSHCALGVVQAHAAAEQQGCIRAATVPTHECGDQQDTSADAGSPSACAEQNLVEADEGNNTATSGVGELYASASELLHTCTQLFAAMQHAVRRSTNASNLFGVCGCFAPAAAVEALQAWHIAGLQGWSSCQAALGAAIALLTPQLPLQVQAQLQAMQQLLLPMGPERGMMFLGLLLAPQKVSLPLVTKISSTCSCSATGCSATVGSACTGSAKASRRVQAAEKTRKKCATTTSAGGPATAAICDCVHYCRCQLRSEMQAIAAGQKSLMLGDSSAGSDTSVLERTLLLLADAQAASALGDVAAALDSAEQAVELCRGIIAASTAAHCSSSGTLRSGAALKSTWLLQPSIGSAVHAYAVALYMSALWLMSELLEASGHPADALRALKQLLKLSTESSCSCFTALAHASISAIHLKTGDNDNAVTVAATAVQHTKRFQQQLALAPRQEQQKWQQQLLCAYVIAAGLQTEAGCNLVSFQHATAQRQLTDAIQLLAQTLAAMCTPEQRQQQSVHMLVWRLVGLRSKLQLQLAHSLLVTHGCAAAVQELKQALDDLSAASTCCRCQSTAWPAAHAALQLQMLAWCCPVGSASNQVLQLIGLGSSSSHSNLQAEFAFAAAENEGSSCDGNNAAAAAVQVSTSQTARATNRVGRRTTVRHSSSRGSTGDKASGKASQGSEESAAAAVDPVTWMSQLLKLLPECALQPLLLRDACSMLGRLLQVHDTLQGATLMLQLSLGVSITQQQLLAAHSKMSRTRPHEQQQPANATEAAAATTNMPIDSWNPINMWDSWQRIHQQLDLQPLLADLALAAEEVCGAGIRSSCCDRAGSEAGSTGISQQLSTLLLKVDQVAAQWLEHRLNGLLPSTAVCSLTVTGPEGIATVGAAAADGGWYQLIGPAAAASVVLPPASSSLLICRMLPAAAAAAAGAADGCGQSSALPLLVQLQPPTRPNPGCLPAVRQLLNDFSSILSDSSVNMQDSVHYTTAAQKAKWWKQRLALDARMGALLQQLDEQWLGPWRCLLMQPGQQQVEAAAAAAAATFVAEYFEFVFEDRPRQLLGQLVAVLLVHMDAISPSEQHQAVRDLCQLTQQRVDGLHLRKLLAALEEAHVTVAAAAPVPAQLQQMDRRLANSTQPAHASSSMSCSSGATALTESNATSAAAAGAPASATAAAAAAACVTPAAAKARSRLPLMHSTTVGAKKPQSRLKAMQKHKVEYAACSDVTDVAVAGLADMLAAKTLHGVDQKLKDHAATDQGPPAMGSFTAAADGTGADAITQQQQQQQTGHSKRAASTDGRRVRFAAAAAEGTSEQEHLMYDSVPVPPSLARHAVRRSRLANLQGTATAALQSAGTCDNYSSSGSTGVHALVEEDSDSNVAAAGNLDAFAKPSLCTAAGVGHHWAEQQCRQQQQQQQCPWVPSVLLLLDNQLQQLPWESLPGLSKQNTYRCPSISLAAAAVTRYKAAQYSHSNKKQLGSGGSGSNVNQDATVQLCLQDGYYLLNPDGDLQATQEAFEGWLQQLGLQGLSGSRPSPAQLKLALESHNLFLYFGHGAGEQYVPLTALKQLNRCAAAVLMGCSSGRLKQLGLYEPSGAMWAYLLAGCPAAVANLWDVTDRDIDRFAQAIIRQWASSNSDGSSVSSLGQNSTSNTTRGRDGRTSLHGGEALQNIGAGSDAITSLPRQAGSITGVSVAVAASRQACRLPNLIGAAAVCYGLPACAIAAAVPTP